MEPTWVSDCGTVKLWCGDCREVLPVIGHVDAIVTDPPYGTGAWKRPIAGAGQDCSAVHSQEAWDEWDDSWIQGTNAKTIGMFVPQTRLQRFRRMFVWIKPDPRPRFGGQPAYGFEPFVVVRGSVRNCGGVDYIVSSSPRERRDDDATGHPHQKPLDVMLRAIELCSCIGEVVCDPYMGSGTTGVAAVQTGCKFFGIEQDHAYFDIAKRRIQDALNSQPLFKDQDTERQEQLF